MATAAVYKYLKDQNRPYSANDIVQNINKEFGKTAVQKALDELAQDEKILEKTYGKQKVYCIIQEPETPSSQYDDIQNMDRQIEKFQETLTSTESKIKACESELKMLNSSLTTEQAIEEKQKLTKNVERLKSKLDDLRQNSVKISPETKAKIEKAYEMNMKEYRKRKRICMDILNGILENYPKKKKDLFEDIGIETDEDVGCNLLK